MPTTPEGFYYPDTSTNLSLVAILAAMAASSDAAHKNAPVVYNTIAARNAAIPSPTEGRVVYTKDYDITWYYNGSGWKPIGTPTFATTTARDAALSSVSAGDRCFVGSGSTMAEYVHNGTAWILWSAPKQNVPITAAGWSAGGWGSGVWVSKSSGLVTVQIGAHGTSTTGLALCTLPTGFRPFGDAIILPGARQGWGAASMHVQTNGVLSIAVDGVAATEWYAEASFWGGY